RAAGRLHGVREDPGQEPDGLHQELLRRATQECQEHVEVLRHEVPEAEPHVGLALLSRTCRTRTEGPVAAATGPSVRAELAVAQLVAACSIRGGSASSATAIRRGLASSATGMVSASTPSR